QTARTDPDAAVRSAAAHSLGCQRCKSAPLETDLIGPLLEIALGDAHPRVRREALYRLCELPPDLRAAAALQTILRRETGRQVWSAAHRALGRHAGASPAPVDLVAPMIRNALAGEHPQIRRDAIRWLGCQPANPRIAAVLRTVLEREASGESRAVAHRALMRHDAAYRQAHVERQR